MIISCIEQYELIKAKDPIKYWYAYDWLMIERSYKGREWFVEKGLDKGLMRKHHKELDKYYWVYMHEFEITQNRNVADERPLAFDVIPDYVDRLRNTKDTRDIPEAIKKLYYEIYPKIEEAAGV